MKKDKFRAWDTKNQVMLSDIAVGDGFCGRQTEDHISHYESDHEAAILIPMQYTGFNDRNEVEIYDNDRVDGGASVTGLVYWNEDYGQWWISPEDTTPNVQLHSYHKSLAVVGTGHDTKGQKLPSAVTGEE